MTDVAEEWPELSEARDGPTIATLHLFSQVAGKVAVALLPWRNHGWHVTLHVHPRGLRTELLQGSAGSFELQFDFVAHQFALTDQAGTHAFPLAQMSVAELFGHTMALLAATGHAVRIDPLPNEINPAIAFRDDYSLRSYEPDSARWLLQALLAADRVLRLFRSSFLGKVSPVHFFWGSFDLAVTRFSGRSAPLHPGGIPHLPDPVTREAYSHEVSSAGFWPGGAMGGAPMFYSYAYPRPEGFATAMIEPPEAHWDDALSEFVLAYDAVRLARDPTATLLAFLTSTYSAAANLAHWDRRALECAIGQPRVPRRVG
jgi:hypothetical protein